MTLRVEVARHVARMVVMFARDFLLTGLVAMTLRIEVARNVARVIVVLARDFLQAGFVAVTLRVQIARNVAGMVVMLTGLLFCHDAFLQNRSRIIRTRAVRHASTTAAATWCL
jgi:hypothetical protein